VGGERIDLGIRGIADAVEIGRGAYAVVYRAFQPAFQRPVAVKLLSVPRLQEQARRNFERECQAIGRLYDAPNIVPVYDSGFRDDGIPYLIMAYMPGGSLEDRMGQGPVPWPEVVEVGHKLARALAAAHEIGVLHRDVKPANVLMSRHGEPHLGDFGIAVAADWTRDSRGGFLGTPLYAPPEEIEGKPFTARSDVYSLGSTLHALLAGRPAFLGETDESELPVLLRVVSEPVPDLRPLGVPDPVCAAIEHAMAKAPADRPPSAAAFAAELAAARDRATAAARRAVYPEPAEPLPADARLDTVQLPAVGGPPQPGSPVPPPPGAPVPTAPGPAPAPGPPPDGPGRRARRRRGLVAASALVVVLAGAATAVVLSRNDPGRGPGAAPPAPTSPTPATATTEPPPAPPPPLVLETPDGIALAADGRLFVADRHRVLVAAPDGALEPFAGTGQEGFGGDGGPARDALLRQPLGVAAAPDGSVLIADSENHRVRRVGPDGVIGTIAGTGEVGFSGDGGPAREARFQRPTGLAVAPDGSIYVTDSLNHRVRVISPNGVVTTVAGTGEVGALGDGGLATLAQLNHPVGVTIGPDGSIYVADAGNRRIRRVTATGTITTVVGSGELGGAGDGGPATQAELNGPFSVAVAADGSIYVADAGNQRVRRVTPAGTITTVAGTGQRGFGGDGGPATQARLNTPTDLALARDGSVYVADRDNNRVRRVTPAGTISTVAGG
jgi:sugar lactone lactonase YvrE/tRNA A-37 threonylcarbamoyl transferase component Bud32